MARRPDLSKLDSWLGKKDRIDLTDAEYENITGLALPKDRYYLLNRSALARRCIENGYEIRLIDKRVIIEKKNEP